MPCLSATLLPPFWVSSLFHVFILCPCALASGSCSLPIHRFSLRFCLAYFYLHLLNFKFQCLCLARLGVLSWPFQTIPAFSSLCRLCCHLDLIIQTPGTFVAVFWGLTHVGSCSQRPKSLWALSSFHLRLSFFLVPEWGTGLQRRWAFASFGCLCGAASVMEYSVHSEGLGSLRYPSLSFECHRSA